MIRKWVLLFLPIFCCLALSCIGGDQYMTDEPPAKAKELARWWQEKIDNMPLPDLAIYAEASEAHQRGGTAATYVDFFMGRTMGGTHYYTFRLPCPPPDHAFARMRQRLKDHQITASLDKLLYGPPPLTPPGPDHQPEITASPDKSVAHHFDWFPAEDCRGCTPERAKAIWEEAKKKVCPKEKG
ncbi:MAG TPA: hypothetical protein VH643_08335 [Gemmataceae bacterium]|jgi:hypothetical protein